MKQPDKPGLRQITLWIEPVDETPDVWVATDQDYYATVAGEAMEESKHPTKLMDHSFPDYLKVVIPIDIST